MEDYMQLMAEKIFEIEQDIQSQRAKRNQQKLTQSESKDQTEESEETGDWRDKIELKNRGFFVKQIAKAVTSDTEHIDPYKLNLLNSHCIKVLTI